MLPSQPQVPEIGSKFQIVESFKEAAQQGAKAAGFAFSMLLSKISRDEKGGQAPYIILQCCPVALYAVLDEKAIHCLPQHQQLNTEQKELVHMILKNIVNERDRIRNALNEGSNNDTTMWLLQMLEERQYIVCHLLSKDGCMKNLFFIYIEAAHCAAICPKVLIVDATYKTNLYKLPLINSVENKKEYIYEWFLNTLKETVYDAFFCLPEVFVSDKSQALRNAANKFFDSDDDYEKLLLSIQKVAYAEEISIVEEAFEKIKQAAMKNRDFNYIQNYFEEWKKDSEYWMYVYTKHYPHMGVQSRNEQKEAIALVGKISRWAIDRIKKEICEAQENYDNTINSICNCSLRLNFKLPCCHIIPSTGPIPLSIIHPRWLLKHDSVPLLPSSLSTNTAFNKALYMLEEKYANLNNSRSKASLLHKIEALIAEEIVIPKAPAAKKKEKNTSKFTTDLPKSQQLLYHDQIPTYMYEHIKKVINVDGDGNCRYRALAICLQRDKNEWSEIRKELQKELIKKKQFYCILFLVNDDYETIIKEIS
ncbi:25207_t:CDS:2 [Cetraspora pellucida]|uniref:25207_t:CDS:1 n=1 Tax=Cetraspora pellucida TaxID=1433469 RepID=A0A9N8ZJ47_9GLOM|nr:25207_t:CDS:2 [Cetraspora pellucida]